MKTFLIAAAVSAAMVGGAHAATYTFDGLATGAAVNSVTEGGFSAVVSTISNRAASNGGTNQAVVFDTGNPTGNDADLGGPFAHQGSGPALSPGKILIIAGPDNGQGLPDDDARGGSITFSFARAVNLLGFDFFDTEPNGNQLVLTTDTGFTSGFLIAGDNRYDSFAQTLRGVRTATFTFGGSGGIDNLSVSAVPLPAALPLLFGALGAMGIFARRRRKAA